MNKAEADKKAAEIIKKMADDVDMAYERLGVNRTGLDGPVPEEVKRIKEKGMEELKKLHKQVKE